MSEELEKQAQEKLSVASALINEAAELAELGGFQISFGRDYGTYLPTSMFDKDKIRQAAIASCAKSVAGWDGMEEDERASYIEDREYDIKYDSVPYEHCDGPGWWMPSRNC